MLDPEFLETLTPAERQLIETLSPAELQQLQMSVANAGASVGPTAPPQPTSGASMNPGVSPMGTLSINTMTSQFGSQRTTASPHAANQSMQAYVAPSFGGLQKNPMLDSLTPDERRLLLGEDAGPVPPLTSTVVPNQRPPPTRPASRPRQAMQPSVPQNSQSYQYQQGGNVTNPLGNMAQSQFNPGTPSVQTASVPPQPINQTYTQPQMAQPMQPNVNQGAPSGVPMTHVYPQPQQSAVIYQSAQYPAAYGYQSVAANNSGGFYGTNVPISQRAVPTAVVAPNVAANQQYPTTYNQNMMQQSAIGASPNQAGNQNAIGYQGVSSYHQQPTNNNQLNQNQMQNQSLNQNQLQAQSFSGSPNSSMQTFAPGSLPTNVPSPANNEHLVQLEYMKQQREVMLQQLEMQNKRQRDLERQLNEQRLQHEQSVKRLETEQQEKLMKEQQKIIQEQIEKQQKVLEKQLEEQKAQQQMFMNQLMVNYANLQQQYQQVHNQNAAKNIQQQEIVPDTTSTQMSENINAVQPQNKNKNISGAVVSAPIQNQENVQMVPNLTTLRNQNYPQNPTYFAQNQTALQNNPQSNHWLQNQYQQITAGTQKGSLQNQTSQQSQTFGQLGGNMATSNYYYPSSNGQLSQYGNIPQANTSQPVTTTENAVDMNQYFATYDPKKPIDHKALAALMKQQQAQTQNQVSQQVGNNNVAQQQLNWNNSTQGQGYVSTSAEVPQEATKTVSNQTNKQNASSLPFDYNYNSYYNSNATQTNSNPAVFLPANSTKMESSNREAQIKKENQVLENNNNGEFSGVTVEQSSGMAKNLNTASEQQPVRNYEMPVNQSNQSLALESTSAPKALKDSSNVAEGISSLSFSTVTTERNKPVEMENSRQVEEPMRRTSKETEISKVSENVEKLKVEQGSSSNVKSFLAKQLKPSNIKRIAQIGKTSNFYQDKASMDKLLSDLDKLEKHVVNMHKQTLNGPTILQREWNELESRFTPVNASVCEIFLSNSEKDWPMLNDSNRRLNCYSHNVLLRGAQTNEQLTLVDIDSPSELMPRFCLVGAVGSNEKMKTFWNSVREFEVTLLVSFQNRSQVRDVFLISLRLINRLWLRSGQAIII